MFSQPKNILISIESNLQKVMSQIQQFKVLDDLRYEPEGLKIKLKLEENWNFYKGEEIHYQYIEHMNHPIPMPRCSSIETNLTNIYSHCFDINDIIN